MGDITESHKGIRVDGGSRGELYGDASARQGDGIFLFRQRHSDGVSTGDGRETVSAEARRDHGFTSSPVARTDRLYITNEDGHTYVVAKGHEYKVLGENELGETVMATAAISGDVI